MRSLVGQARREPRVDEATYTVKAEANRGTTSLWCLLGGSGWDRSKARRAQSYGGVVDGEQRQKVKVRSWARGKRSGQSGKSERGVQKGAKQGEVVLNRRGARPAVVFPRHTARGSGASLTWQPNKTETIN